MQIPQLQVTFNHRKELESVDLTLIKKLKLKPMGKNAWISFREFQWGLLPWYFTQEHVSLMAYALEQLLNVAPRCKDDPSLLFPGTPNENISQADLDALILNDSDDEWDENDDEVDLEEYVPLESQVFFRVRQTEGDIQKWVDEVRTVAEPMPTPPEVVVNPELVRTVQGLRKAKHTVEIEVTMFPIPMTDDEHDRPYLPHLMLMADAKTGVLLSNDLLKPLPSLAAMNATIPELIMMNLVKAGMLPRIIQVKNPLLQILLNPYQALLKFRVRVVDYLPAIDAASQMLMQMLAMDPIDLEQSESLEDFDDLNPFFPKGFKK